MVNSKAILLEAHANFYSDTVMLACDADGSDSISTGRNNDYDWISPLQTSKVRILQDKKEVCLFNA